MIASLTMKPGGTSRVAELSLTGALPSMGWTPGYSTVAVTVKGVPEVSCAGADTATFHGEITVAHRS